MRRCRRDDGFERRVSGRVLMLIGAIFLGCCSAYAQVSVEGPLSYEFDTSCGEICEGQFVVANSGTEDVQVMIEPRDYLFFADGRNEYASPGTVDRSNAMWLRIQVPSLMEIGPGERRSVPFRVAIPESLELLGTYWSIILVRPMQPETDSAEAAVRQVLQYGVQVVTHLGDTAEPRIEVIAADLAVGRDEATLTVDIANVGERWARPRSWVELFDGGGNPLGDVSGNQLRIFPGTSVRFTFSLPAGLGQTCYAMVVLDNGEDDGSVWGIQLTLEL